MHQPIADRLLDARLILFEQRRSRGHRDRLEQRDLEHEVRRSPRRSAPIVIRSGVATAKPISEAPTTYSSSWAGRRCRNGRRRRWSPCAGHRPPAFDRHRDTRQSIAVVAVTTPHLPSAGLGRRSARHRQQVRNAAALGPRTSDLLLPG
jgi:hypothetical protein